MVPISRAYLTWITVPAGTAAGATIKFPDVSRLRGKRIIGVEAYDDVMLAFTPDGQTVIATADGPKVVLTLRRASDSMLDNVPIRTLMVNVTAGIWKQLRPFEVDFQKSDIFMAGTPAATAFTVPFLFYYLDEGE